MQEHITDDVLRKIASEVEREYGMGRLCGGTIYEYFAVDVAKRALLMAARLADDSDHGPIPHHIGDQIRARFNITD
jgi:hypothetical protein